jgi:hypothetical protein
MQDALESPGPDIMLANMADISAAAYIAEA